MLILIGSHMQSLHQQLPASQWFANTDALLTWLNEQPSMFTAQDTILVKASHGMQLCKVVTLLTEQGNRHVI